VGEGEAEAEAEAEVEAEVDAGGDVEVGGWRLEAEAGRLKLGGWRLRLRLRLGRRWKVRGMCGDVRGGEGRGRRGRRGGEGEVLGERVGGALAEKCEES
jgi:hypothetical protein